MGSVVDRPTDEASYANAQPCINLSAVRGHTVLDSSHIVFHLSRGRYMLSQLRPRCAALRVNDTIQLNPSSSSRLCAMDALDVLADGPSARGSGGAPGRQVIDRCFLGAFEAISKEHMVALKDAVQSHR